VGLELGNVLQMRQSLAIYELLFFDTLASNIIRGGVETVLRVILGRSVIGICYQATPT
jgi:hypothetical protein